MIYKDIISPEEFDVCNLISIVLDFERNSLMEEDDCKVCLNSLYECIDGYLGFTTDFDEFAFDENGEEIKHTLNEYYKFIDNIYHEILKVFIGNVDAVQDLMAEAYQRCNELYELEKDVQSYR